MNFFSKILSTGVILAAIAPAAFAQASVQAKQAVNSGIQASGYASASAAHGIIASGQVTSAAAAIPLMAAGAVVGAVGNASMVVGQEAMRAANAPIGAALPISDESVTVMSPAEALKAK